MFDIDNSGVIMVEEIHQSVQVSKTLGTELWPKGNLSEGSLEDTGRNWWRHRWDCRGNLRVYISEAADSREGRGEGEEYLHLYLNRVDQVDLQDFVQLCLMDKPLGDAVLQIFRAVISKWSVELLSSLYIM